MKRLVKALVVLAALALAGWYAYVRLTEGERPEEQRQQASYTAVRRGPRGGENRFLPPARGRFCGARRAAFL